MISAVVFQILPLGSFGDPTFNFTTSITELQILDYIRDAYIKLKTALDAVYSNAIIPTLFKDMSKCTDLYTRIKQGKV